MSLVIGAQIFSQEDVFLGDLVPASASLNSVCDSSGSYGSEHSETSIRNRFGPYGSPDGAESAFNIYATAPPVVTLNGETLGTLTISPFSIDAIEPYELLSELGCS